jgi:NTE family protein
MKPDHSLNPKKLRIALILQGGGALGAYQAGVYQALHEHGLEPDWIVGNSIGAVNAALLAGNPRAARLQSLKTFWGRVSHADAVDLRLPDAQRRSNVWLSAFDTVLNGVPGFFTPRPLSAFSAGLAVTPEEASFYETSALADTLGELLDFDYLNAPGGMRLTLNAMKVKTGELVSFDTGRQVLSSDHVRASVALPPGFPPVRIDGELYWDGGLYSNTPLATVLDDLPNVDSLCFMVDLWSAEGVEPTTLNEVQTRQKDVAFASHFKRNIDDYLHARKLYRMVRELHALLPEAARADPRMNELAMLCGDCTMHVVRLPYAGSDWSMPAKDISFSKGAIQWRWDQGYADALRIIGAAAWLAAGGGETGDKGLRVHELPPLARGRRAADGQSS